jgi:hypothetical protein
MNFKTALEVTSSPSVHACRKCPAREVSRPGRSAAGRTAAVYDDNEADMFDAAVVTPARAG